MLAGVVEKGAGTGCVQPVFRNVFVLPCPPNALPGGHFCVAGLSAPGHRDSDASTRRWFGARARLRANGVGLPRLEHQSPGGLQTVRRAPNARVVPLPAENFELNQDTNTLQGVITVKTETKAKLDLTDFAGHFPLWLIASGNLPRLNEERNQKQKVVRQRRDSDARRVACGSPARFKAAGRDD